MDRTTTVAFVAIAGLGITAAAPAPAGVVCSVFDGRPCAPTLCSVFDRRACAPAVCSVFDHEPCLPEVEFPLGQSLRWTIKSAAIDHHRAPTIVGDPVASAPRKLDTLRAMFDALGGCWVPPANGEAWAGMEISIRFAFKRSGDLIAAPVMTYASRHAPASARQSYFDSIRGALEGLLPTLKSEETRGKAEVREIFHVSKSGTVAGCMVVDGIVGRTNNARVIRDGQIVVPTAEDVKRGRHRGIASLRRFKDDVKEVRAGMECGIRVENFDDVKPGDVIEAYEVIETKQKL